MIKSIPATGMEFSEKIPPESIGITEEDLKCLAPLEVKAKVEKIQNTVVAKTQVRGKFQFTCSRCLDEIELESSEDYSFEYIVDPTTVSIDLGEDIRQEVILDVPARVLCKEDCKGLCPKCGSNLNKEICRCKN